MKTLLENIGTSISIVKDNRVYTALFILPTNHRCAPVVVLSTVITLIYLDWEFYDPKTNLNSDIDFRSLNLFRRRGVVRWRYG